MQTLFQKHIDSEFPELLTRPFIIALSGGVDSVVLAHLCHHLNLDFALAHCNFQLRGKDSEEDLKFVQEFAKSIQRKLFYKRFETEKIAEEQKESIQISARSLRYNWFHELIDTTKYAYLLTAHHLNDSLETFIINLSRSTGIKGLTGIPDRNAYIRRPLLKFSKDNIKEYAITNDIKWREDISNESTKYLRNQIRQEVVPGLLELTPNFLKNFESSLQKLKETEALLEDYTTLLFKTLVHENKNYYEIDINKLSTFPNQKSILYQLLNSFGFTEWEDVYHLTQAQTGKRVESSTHQLIKDREKLILSPLSSGRFETVKIYADQKEVVFDNFKLRLEEVKHLGEFNSQIIYVDKAKLKFPLRIRSVQQGDYFYPFGMKGKKKLSDFLKDEKISPHLKTSQLVLCNGSEEIIWVLNLRADDRFKVEHKTENILKIEIVND
jgi:tRNA(Ile)-lysidine synthase